jgi:hypothetical protein
MIAHQTIGMHLPLRLLTGLLQGGEKLLAVQIVLENILAAISPIDNVANRSRILHAQFARHGTILPQTQKVSIVRTDTHGINPFDYLKDLFTRLPAAKITQIKEFTPAAWAKAKKAQERVVDRAA